MICYKNENLSLIFGRSGLSYLFFFFNLHGYSGQFEHILNNFIGFKDNDHIKLLLIIILTIIQLEFKIIRLEFNIIEIQTL